MNIEVAGRTYTDTESMRAREDAILRAVRDGVADGEHEALNAEWQRLSAARIDAEESNDHRRDAIRSAGARESNREGPAGSSSATHEPHESSELRSRALAANDRADFLPPECREHMERQLRADDDPNERLARFTVETSDRAYFRAFSKWMNDPVSGGHEWTDQERQAVQRVKHMERSMTLGAGGAGGFLVPYELDPAIIIASTGYVDPMRAVSRVDTVAVGEKRYVTSLGVTSSWDPEETEVSDDSPALLQPTIVAKKAQTFTPVSVELFEDSGIATEIAKLFADSKAQLESVAFTTGAGGANEPRGIITALVALGGAIVIATGTNVLAQGDLYNNQAALPARWRPNAKWMMNLSILNGFRQLPQATGLNYSVISDAQSPPTALGWQVHENNAMDSTLTGAAADYLVLSGDFQQYAIVDRIGTSIEVVPHLFGAARRPTGQRGFYQHWRVGGDVLVGDAFRLSNYST